jgi:hypothetical protein
VTIIQETHEKRYQLDEEYVQAGWSLEWDEVGWCTAVHAEYGRTAHSFPSKSRGLKNLYIKINRLMPTTQVLG